MTKLTPKELLLLVWVYCGIQPGDYIVTENGPHEDTIRALMSMRLLRYDGRLALTPSGVHRVMLAMGEAAE